MSFTIRGTTTAGETAPMTAPITAASTRVTPRIIGANRIYPQISNDAGTNDIRIAGRPTFLRSDRFNDNPALSRIMISANFRSSAEIPRIDGDNKSSTYGPSTIPVASIPMMPGRRICLQMADMASPTRKISASDVNIFFLLGILTLTESS